MGYQRNCEEIRRILSQIAVNVQLAAGANDGGESFYEGLFGNYLNRLYGWSLKSGNIQSSNAAGYDLIDAERRIVVQVSKKDDFQKVQKALRNSAARLSRLSGAADPQNDGPWHFYFLVLKLEQTPHRNAFELCGMIFDPKKDVLDFEDLYAATKDCQDAQRVKEILKVLVDWIGRNPGLKSGLELEENLKARLAECRRNHPSFVLMEMGKIDERLFGKAKRDDSADFQAEQPASSEPQYLPEQPSYGSLKNGGPVSPVWQLVQESWKKGEKKVVLIEGEGGSGKTVALFSIISPDGETQFPAIYISLCEFGYWYKKKQSQDFEDYLGKKYRSCKDGILRLSEQKWADRPPLLVLLDGVNEVQADYRQDVLSCIRRWSEGRGAQLIFSSRPLGDTSFTDVFDPCGRGDFLRIELEPLGRETIRSCLKQYPRAAVRIPRESSPLWEILKYPLFLNLYIQTARLPALPCGYQLSIRNPESCGALIWNYFQRELLRRNSAMECGEADKEDWIVNYSFACGYLLPELAFHMLGNDPYRIDKRSAERVIERALRAYDPNKLPLHLRDIWKHYGERVNHDASALIDPEDCKKWVDRVLYHTGLLLPGQEGFQFVHEHFRDCLAGFCLDKQAEMEVTEGGKKLDQIPALWQEHMPKEALDYAADLMQKNVFQALWTANRLFWKRNAVLWADDRPLSAEQWEEKQRAETLLYNLLELRRIQNQKGIAEKEAGLNFSYMDLRKLNLSRYCSTAEVDMRLFRNPGHSTKTRLSEDTFRGPGHRGTVSCVAALPGHRCVSAAYDGTLRIWDVTTGQLAALLTDEMEGPGTANSTIRCGCLALAPTENHGTLIVNGSDDGLLRVWDDRSGRLVRRLAGHEGPITAVLALPDGRIASSSQDGTLRLWDPDRDEALWSKPAAHGSPVTCLAKLDCGDSDDEEDHAYRLVCGTQDGKLWIWDRDGKACRDPLSGHSGAITDIVCVPGGDFARTIVSADETGKLISWGRNCQKTELLQEPTKITRLAVLPDGSNDRILVGEQTGKVVVCSLSDRRSETLREASGKDQPVNCFTALKEAERTGKDREKEPQDCYLICFGNSTPEIWGADNRLRRTLSGHEDYVRCAALLPNGRCVTGSNDRSLRVWDPDSGLCLQTMFGYTSAITDITVLSKHRVAACSWDRKIRIWDLDERKCERILPAEPADGHSSRILALETLCDPENREERIVSASKDCSVMIWSPERCEPLQRISPAHAKSVTCVAVRPDGSFVTGSGDRKVKLWRRQGDEWKDKELPSRGTAEAYGVNSVAAIGSRWIAASDYSSLLLWDLEMLSRGEKRRCQILLPKAHERYITSLDTDGGDLLVSAGCDGKILIWDVKHPKQAPRAIGGDTQLLNQRCVRLIDWKGRRMVVSGGDDRLLRLWDAESGEALGRLMGHTDWVRCVTVLPEGWFPNGQLISGSSDRTLRIWDLESGACVCKLEAMETDVFGMDFSEAELTEDLREMLRQNGAKIREDESGS